MSETKEKSGGKYIDLFFGPLQIKDIVDSGEQTTNGQTVFVMTFEDGKKRTATSKELEVVCTKEAKDWNHIRDAKFEYMKPEMMFICEDYNLSLADVSAFGNDFIGSVNEWFNRADNFLWTGDDSKYTAGYDAMNDNTVVDALLVIKEIQSKKEDGDTTEKDTTADSAA